MKTELVEYDEDLPVNPIQKLAKTNPKKAGEIQKPPKKRVKKSKNREQKDPSTSGRRKKRFDKLRLFVNVNNRDLNTEHLNNIQQQYHVVPFRIG